MAVVCLRLIKSLGESVLRVALQRSVENCRTKSIPLASRNSLLVFSRHLVVSNIIIATAIFYIFSSSVEREGDNYWKKN